MAYTYSGNIFTDESLEKLETKKKQIRIVFNPTTDLTVVNVLV